MNFGLCTLTLLLLWLLDYQKMSGAEQPAPAAIPEEGIKEKDPILVEINKKIENAFDIFDHESNKTVDVRYTQK